MKALLLVIFCCLLGFSNIILSQEMRHSTAMFALMCPRETDLDREKALVTYNPTTHVMRLTTDMFEVVDSKPAMDTT